MEAHLEMSHNGQPVGPGKPSVCTNRRKCRGCQKLLQGQNEIKEHGCGYLTCHSCKEYVDISEHKCFIQLAPNPREMKEEQKKKNKKNRHGAAAGLQTLRANNPKHSLGGEEEEDKEPLHVFFDIESMQTDDSHVPNLVVAETEHDDRPVRFRGEHCICDFLEWINTWTEDETRPLTVFTHNFEGCDSYPVIGELHNQKRAIEQVRNGGKMLELKVGVAIRFIDSLSFFQMPLSAFPKTFGLTKLKKGYFPYLVNMPDYQHYIGDMPPKKDYMPKGMSVKGAGEFDKWYDQQVVDGVVFDFAKELIKYCESDVKLLKQGCLSFKRDFERLANFNLFDQMTIALACNNIETCA